MQKGELGGQPLVSNAACYERDAGLNYIGADVLSLPVVNLQCYGMYRVAWV